MSTTFTALILAAAILSPGTAGQQTQERRDAVQQRLAEVKERLALTPEQIEQVRPVLAEEAQRLRALRDKYEGSGSASRRSRRSMARELRDIRSDTDARLKRILSKSQMDELKKLREEWRRELRSRAR